jgi:hypothetical protein
MNIDLSPLNKRAFFSSADNIDLQKTMQRLGLSRPPKLNDAGSQPLTVSAVQADYLMIR